MGGHEEADFALAEHDQSGGNAQFSGACLKLCLDRVSRRVACSRGIPMSVMDGSGNLVPLATIVLSSSFALGLFGDFRCCFTPGAAFPVMWETAGATWRV